MQKKKSIQVSSVVFASLSLISLFQTSIETYHYVGANEGQDGLGGAALITVATRVIFALFLLGSSILFFRHREIGRKAMLVAAYSGLIYMAYVFYGMYEASHSAMFLLIGLGNVLVIGLFVRWLHSQAVREAVQ